MSLNVALILSGILDVALLIIFPILYFKIKQLSQRNKLLKALRSLDEAALAHNDLKIICQEIVNLIRQNLGYFFGAIALVDQESGGIRRIAISYEPQVEKALSIIPIKFSEQVVPFTVADNLLIKAFSERKVYYSTKMYDIQRGVLSEELSKQVQAILNVEGIYIYPLVTTNDTIGVIYYFPQIGIEKISKMEFEAMEAFTGEVSRILDNILLYQDLRKMSDKLITANRELKELDRLKDDFISITSHELRTPLTAIKSYIWMALHKSDLPLSDRSKEYLIKVLLSTDRLINLVTDMLNVSRIESGSIEINPEPVDLISLVKDIMDELYYSKSEEKKLKFVVLNKVIPKVFADPGKLRQVLLNLVGNSLKFTPTGGQIIFDFLSDGRVVEIAVSDTGVGISKEDISKLFHKFGRLDNSYTAAATSGGTGLGLYISKSLVELMHGRIWAQSAGLNKGATFIISLPVATPDVLKDIAKYRVEPKGELKALEPAVLT